MRRQSKPFVTEYKSSSRRPKDGPEHEPLLETALDSGRLDPFRAEAARMIGSDDGYDAALRAADALFSPKPSTAPAPTDENGKGDATPLAGPERNGGRILQAIEDAPVDRFAELEALHAPKRRGRKPGSKNKPKVAAILEPQAVQPKPARVPVAAPRAAAQPVMAAAPRVVIPAVSAAPAVAATRERFGWVRTTLRPGERWKRRLPKVAW